MEVSISDIEKVVNSGLTTVIKESKISFNQLFLKVNLEDLYSTISFLKINEKCKFRQLIDITAIDYPDQSKRFVLVYLLLSHENNQRVVLKTEVQEQDSIPTITKIFPSANWMEREVFDMYGLSFKDHPDLRRILTDYDFKGYPLRKDFPLTGHNEVRYSENKKKVIYEPIKLEQNYRNFDFKSPWDGTKYNFDKELKDDKNNKK
ncbi:MAG: NADH-quinone oxidoreductase subunit C [Candidatus Pelagibacter sp. TMED64]|nr:NADH-quinone oxidoreductase subunit C [Candidatus Pelagibacter sp.]OUU67562.1 MAG: NADH-quinone oxidoreductase subunit C [Candidatus Pelagibacter sp. TMED64]|tara:strand:- start:420 stop:1034 length:615 start_codon:yes stop_codon:yes gene_type:complete